MSKDNTPGQECRHPAPPADPAARAEWFAAMTSTHTASKCPNCQLLRVWTPIPKEQPTLHESLTLGDFRKMTAALPDNALLVLESMDEDLMTPYQRVPESLGITRYSNVYTVVVSDVFRGIR